MDEQIVAQVEQQVSIKQETQQVSIHKKSLDYDIIVNVFLITQFVIAIATITTSQDEGDNDHKKTIIEIQQHEQLQQTLQTNEICVME